MLLPLESMLGEADKATQQPFANDPFVLIKGLRALPILQCQGFISKGGNLSVVPGLGCQQMWILQVAFLGAFRWRS